MLRTIALLVSVIAHGLVGYAIWPRLERQETKILDFGAGQNIELTPQGMVANEITNLGDNIQSLETQDVVPVDQQQPKPKAPSNAPPKLLRDVADDVVKNAPREIAALDEQKPSVRAPISSVPNQLRDVPEATVRTAPQDVAALEENEPSVHAPSAAIPKQLQDVSEAGAKIEPREIAAIEEQKPSLRAPTAATPDQLHDVPEAAAKDTISDSASLQDDNPTPRLPVVAATDSLNNVDVAENKSEPVIEPSQVQKPSPRPILSSPEPQQNVVAPEKREVQQDIMGAPQPKLPDPLPTLRSATAGDLPPPEQLKELKKVAKADEAFPPEPVKPEKPEDREVIARPEQVAIVTELSSGEEKTGGDARIVGLYLGKVNAQVQRSKVNPRSRKTGNVLLRFTIGTDGSLLSKQVASSSGSDVLDDAALAAIDRAAPFPAVPAEVSLKPMTFTQLFRFVVR